MKGDQLSRRRFITNGAIALAGTFILPKISFANNYLGWAKPNSVVGGVQIGVITYSFRSMPGTVDDLLKYCIDCNISAIELMGDAAEVFAGIPKRDQALSREENAKKIAEWRASVPMDKFKELRKMYNDAGVKIYAWKPTALDARHTDEEIAYAFKAGKAMGASHCTVELPNDTQTARLGKIAEQQDMKVGYHAHTQATPTLWDKAMEQSKANCINLDLGHYVSGTSSSPVPFLEKNHDRIVSMHIKDRKFNNGPNAVWGEGDTPIKDVLKLVKKNKWKFPVTIELEYNVPQGSDAVAEVKKCREFAAEALSS
ncbi:sugar phosphate isomerase/epimerase family protein [Mucilaginibacter myungsuensis]|uniref:Sugar phosphate isomerase/epimerase n=1 Tax=Mucilaginibacter myungsuensis TaxID=649104 RepID=A0A929KWA1_9SPHI|nr:sugar phosphate isomerase/epimerase [Mucilaginibacter myungsuensis]MBE9661088.1 sugar phosphate isomerase/epimerase [Mucilaginibacter myungsuensis]MDN3597232.1 sugar phosphate isomerase/epimerase [Mucilaginibacter myungsuensis]